MQTDSMDNVIWIILTGVTARITVMVRYCIYIVCGCTVYTRLNTEFITRMLYEKPSTCNRKAELYAVCAQAYHCCIRTPMNKLDDNNVNEKDIRQDPICI